MIGALVVAIVWLGLYPQPVLDTAAARVLDLQVWFAARHTGSSR